MDVVDRLGLVGPRNGRLRESDHDGRTDDDKHDDHEHDDDNRRSGDVDHDNDLLSVQYNYNHDDRRTYDYDDDRQRDNNDTSALRLRTAAILRSSGRRLYVYELQPLSPPAAAVQHDTCPDDHDLRLCKHDDAGPSCRLLKHGMHLGGRPRSAHAAWAAVCTRRQSVRAVVPMSDT